MEISRQYNQKVLYVAKVEYVRKDQKEFEYEVAVQKKAALSGYVVDVIAHETKQYPKKIYNTEPKEEKCFFIMIMPKMSYSLLDKMNEFPFFGMEAA
jgi:hypothetical protein